MSAWDTYQQESENYAKALGRIIRKRESHLMTRDDKVLADTLAQEMRDLMEEIIASQEKHLTLIQQDPIQLLDVLHAMFGGKGPRPSEINPEDVGKLDPLDYTKTETGRIRRPQDILVTKDIT